MRGACLYLTLFSAHGLQAKVRPYLCNLVDSAGRNPKINLLGRNRNRLLVDRPFMFG